MGLRGWFFVGWAEKGRPSSGDLGRELLEFGKELSALNDAPEACPWVSVPTLCHGGFWLGRGSLLVHTGVKQMGGLGGSGGGREDGGFAVQLAA